MKDLTIISKIALIATKNMSFEEQMNLILETSGKYLQVSRSYIFIDDLSNYTTSNTFEWCNIGVDPEIDTNQNLSYREIPSFRKILCSEGMIITENIKMLPADLCKILEKQDIRSISIYPLKIKNQVRGFIGFDECENHRKWSKAEQRILETLSGIISNIYEKNYIIEEFNIYKNDFERFFDTIEEFIIVGDFEGNIVFANKYVTDILGYTYDKLMHMKIYELHPEKKRKKAKKIIKDMIESKIDYCPIEMMDIDGKIISVETRVWLGKWKNKDCIIGISKNLSRDEASLLKFRKLFRSNPAPMVIVSVDEEKFIDVNEAFTDKFGYDFEEVDGKTIDEIGIIIDKNNEKLACREFLERGKIRDIELKVKCKSGKILHGLFSGEIIDIQGKKYHLSVMVDITKQKKIQNLYDMERTRLNSILESTRLGTWEWHVDTGEIIINDMWLDLIGYSKKDFNMKNIRSWMKYVHEDDLARTRKALRSHLKKETNFYEVDYRMRHKDGYWVWINDRGKVIEWSDSGKALKMFGTHTDITEKKVIENKLKEISIRDPLTNIFNRRYIYERMAMEIARSKREKTVFSVAIIDIDRFKNINDTFGHIAGDYILKKFTKVISENLRVYDLLGRYGGEEFIVILYGIDKLGASKIIERILKKVRQRIFEYKNHSIKFTFSVGIADVTEFNYDDINNEQIISVADKKLYEAKDEGRNRIKI